MKNNIKIAAVVAALVAVFAFGRIISRPVATSVQAAPQQQQMAQASSSSERQPLPLPTDLKPNEKGEVLNPAWSSAGDMNDDVWLVLKVEPILLAGSTVGKGFLLQGPQDGDREFLEVYSRHPDYASYQVITPDNRIQTIWNPGARPVLYEGDPPLNRSDFIRATVVP